ncbi:MAG TPA: helix-turn-helix transcriptional regulator [Burkholderiales bacterium]|nr:helix-turn-helix transcriptional regulator [Burkholderiales bacterium]
MPKHRARGGARDLRAAESTPRPVTALADSFVEGCVIPAHSHQRAQLIFAVRGTMKVQAGGGLWTLPPSHALWVPAGVVHEIRMSGPVEMRTLYVQSPHGERVGPLCRVLFVSSLLRELIVRAMELPPLYDERGMEGRVMSLILDEIALLPAQPLGLRMPTDPRLIRLCELMLRDLASAQSIARLGEKVGLSQRSVIRLFPKETGLSFTAWHNQARILRAFELFDDGQSVTQAAMELGYSSASAFAKMFRRTLGKPPTEFIAARS